MKITIEVNVKGLEVLAPLFSAVKINNTEQPNTAPPMQAPQQQPLSYAQQIQQAPPAPTPVQQPVIQQQPVPTAQVNYTYDQLAVAATQIVDMRGPAEIQQLMAAFGVSSMMELPPAQYPVLAAQLRQMGAKI